MNIPRIILLVACCSVLAMSCGSKFESITNFPSSGSQIICLGDSITRGVGSTPGNDYPSLLAGMLGREVINAGVNGDTTAAALRRLERDVLTQDPWIVIVELSGNDFLRRVPISQTRKHLDEIVKRCQQTGAIVVLVHCKLGIMLSDPYLDPHESIARDRGALLVKNALRGILGNRSRMSDQIHPNDEGYALIAARIFEELAPLIEAAEEQIRQDKIPE